MLIEFSTTNFRSIRERQTLSMVAAPRLRLNTERNVFQADLPGEKFPRLLKVAVIYGPNASGKSNLLRALAMVGDLMHLEPNSSIAKELPCAPFRFDPALVGKPSEFEVHFITEKMRYQFDLHLQSDRIAYECLTSYPKGVPTVLYSRKYGEHGGEYFFGEPLREEAGPSVLETWQKITPPHMPFIAQAVANSSESVKLLRAPHGWLKHGVLPNLHGMEGLMEATKRLAGKHESLAREVAEFLRDVDVPIAKFSVTSSDETVDILGQSMSGKDSPALKTALTHTSALGSATMTLGEESRGTQNLIGFWLPWSSRNTGDGSARNVLLVDELDSSLHPMIVAALVERHISSPTPTQLIFSTHDTHLMDAKLLRRDQIWITERDINGATKVRCVHDFEGREGEDVEKRYFAGRYRGVPMVKTH